MKSMIFKKKYYEVLNDLPDDLRLQAYDIIMRWAFENNVAKRDDVPDVLIIGLELISREIYRDYQSYINAIGEDYGE